MAFQKIPIPPAFSLYLLMTFLMQCQAHQLSMFTDDMKLYRHSFNDQCLIAIAKRHRSPFYLEQGWQFFNYEKCYVMSLGHSQTSSYNSNCRILRKIFSVNLSLQKLEQSFCSHTGGQFPATNMFECYFRLANSKIVYNYSDRKFM